MELELRAGPGQETPERGMPPIPHRCRSEKRSQDYFNDVDLEERRK